MRGKLRSVIRLLCILIGGTIGLTLAGVALVIGGVGFTSRKKKEQE